MAQDGSEQEPREQPQRKGRRISVTDAFRSGVGFLATYTILDFVHKAPHLNGENGLVLGFASMEVFLGFFTLFSAWVLDYYSTPTHDSSKAVGIGALAGGALILLQHLDAVSAGLIAATSH